LRRSELLALTAASIQLREEHWVIADLHGRLGIFERCRFPFG
jgi:hypothetical protein